MKRILSALLLCAALSGCHGYIVHPGSVNRLDSTAYDALLGAKTVIDTARDEFAAGTLNPKLKPAVNNIVAAYDKATPIYKDWHNAEAKAVGSGSAKLAELNDAITALNRAITAFKGAK